MKHLLPLCFLLMLIGENASAQVFQFNPYYGTTLPMPLRTNYGRFITDGGSNFGVNLSWGNSIYGGGVSQSAFVELQYNYSKSPVAYEDYYNGDRDEYGDLKMHNALLGVTKGGGTEIFEGYGGMYAGVTIFDVEDPEAFDYTRFTVAISAGLKYYVTDYVGIRLHSQLYMPFWASSLYLGWSGGTNSGTISSIVSPYINFNVGIFANIDRSY